MTLKSHMKLNKFEMIFRSNIAVTCKSNLSGETKANFTRDA